MATIHTSKGDINFKRKLLYVGSKQIDKIQALENLKLLSDVLNKKHFNWGPVFGTLLGMVRDNDFITWDEDIDLYVLKEDEEKLKDTLWELKDLGFELIRYERRGLYSIMRKGEYIDFYILRKVASNLRHTGGRDFIFEKYLTDTIIWDFKGVKFNVPRDYDEYLTFQYGDWRTPVKVANFEMGWLHRLILKAVYFTKNNLPDCLYYKMLVAHHQKDIRKFKAKCERKGCPLTDTVNLEYSAEERMH